MTSAATRAQYIQEQPMTSQPIEIYRSADGQAQVEVRFEQETVWLSAVSGADCAVISHQRRQHQLAFEKYLCRTRVGRIRNDRGFLGSSTRRPTPSHTSAQTLQSGRGTIRWLSRQIKKRHPISYLGDHPPERIPPTRLYAEPQTPATANCQTKCNTSSKCTS